MGGYFWLNQCLFQSKLSNFTCPRKHAKTQIYPAAPAFGVVFNSIQKSIYLQLCIKIRCLSIKRNEIDHSCVIFQRGIEFVTVKQPEKKQVKHQHELLFILVILQLYVQFTSASRNLPSKPYLRKYLSFLTSLICL